MAETFGARLLKEVEEESLDKYQLLSSLSTALPIDQNPRLPTIPFLQELLVPPDRPSAAQSNEPPSPLGPAIPSSPSPPAGPTDGLSLLPSKFMVAAPPLMEIISSVPGAKSTHLLSYMVVCLLEGQTQRPKQIVLYFDSAWKLSIQQIYTTLLERSDGDKTTAIDALSRLHIIRPGSSQELLTQLRNVEKYLHGLTNQDCAVAAVILADLSVWYWSERLEEEEIKYQTTEKQSHLSRESLHTMIVEVARRLQSTFKCTFVVSGLAVGSQDTAARSGLSGPWIRAADVKLTLTQHSDKMTQVNIDATKWVQASGSSHGKGTFEIYLEGEIIKATQFKHNT